MSAQHESNTQSGLRRIAALVSLTFAATLAFTAIAAVTPWLVDPADAACPRLTIDNPKVPTSTQPPLTTTYWNASHTISVDLTTETNPKDSHPTAWFSNATLNVQRWTFFDTDPVNGQSESVVYPVKPPAKADSTPREPAGTGRGPITKIVFCFVAPVTPSPSPTS